MLKIALVLVEALCAAGAIVFAVLWVRDPFGSYEPTIALCAALVVGVDLLRRYVRSRKLKIFVSVGVAYTRQQRECQLEFYELLKSQNIERLGVGEDDYSSLQPLAQIKDLLKQCDAVVVLAFLRYVVDNGKEKPGADREEHEERALVGEKHPTVWNQIEAGIAYGLDKPIFVVMEKGLKQGAMLKEDRLETLALTIQLEKEAFRTKKFTGVFNDFISRVRRRSWRQW